MGILVPEKAKLELDSEKDWYISISLYNQNQKELAEEVRDGRIRGISGIKDVVTKLLVFDFDDVSDIMNAHKDARILVDRLNGIGVPEDNIDISFSGCKGFSVVVHFNEYLKHKDMVRIAKSFSSGLETFDHSIYNESRLFRIKNTRHPKSGLFKTHLSMDEFRHFNKNIVKSFNKIKAFQEIKPIPPIKPLIKLKIDFSQKPEYLSPAKYVLHMGRIPEGKGNEGMMILCSEYKKAGIDESGALRLLEEVNTRRSNYYNIEPRQDIKTQIVNCVYNSNWGEKTYGINNELIKSVCEEYDLVDRGGLLSIKDMLDLYAEGKNRPDGIIIKTGLKSLDDTAEIEPGMLVGLLGTPGSGKTAFAVKILESVTESGGAVLFESLDMYHRLLSTRIMRRHDYDVNKIETLYKSVEFRTDDIQSVAKIESDIKITKELHKGNLKFVIVDYLELVEGSRSGDANYDTIYIIKRLSILAKKYDLPILLLLQSKKVSGDVSSPLISLRDIKGASIIEQNCRLVLSMWRPLHDVRDTSKDHYASIAVLKNNMGQTKQIDYHWDGFRGEVSEMNGDQRLIFDSLMEELEEKRKKEEKTFDDW